MWLVFVYAPAALFSLKMSQATSTAGKTLVTPTPYAVKMAFLDSALRHGLTTDPEHVVQGLAKVRLRIGLPSHACVTGTIQRVRQETRDADIKLRPDLPPYRPNIALREFVHYQGNLRFAFDLTAGTPELARLLRRAAPAINYVGKRGGFIQYLECIEQTELDAQFTRPAGRDADPADWGHRASLDDFGTRASFDALNSFSATEIRRGVHRKFVETAIPLGIRNAGPGFVHYASAPEGML
jgi:hypothetical protein